MAKRPMPGEAPNYQELRKGRFSWDTEGLMEGGTPQTNRAIRGSANLNRMAGEDDSRRGRAVQARARNVEGHESATSRTRQAIKGEVLKAKASASDASTYDKLRYKLFEATGMKKGGKAKAKPVKKMAKGGSASKRGDGCATKGKTKGRFV